MTSPEPESRKPRLLVVTSTYPRWEGDHEPGFVHGLARELLPFFDVMVLCPHAPGAAVLEVLDGVAVRRYRYAPTRLETLVNDGGILGNLRHSRWKWLLVPGFLASQVVAFRRLRHSWKPDVVHAHWLLPQGLAATLGLSFPRARTPLVVTSHGTDLHALRAPVLAALKRFVVRRAAAITVVSAAMLDELWRIGGDEPKSHVLPMGVDLTGRFVPDVGSPRSNDEILFVGRIAETKGLRHLLDAMPAVLSARPSARLRVVGFGPELEMRKTQAKALGIGEKVQFEGAMPQGALPALYRRAAMLVAPFEEAPSGAREGLGLVMVEAVGCGCPVVTTRQLAVDDVFGPAGPAALADPGSAHSLATAMLRVLKEPCAARASAVLARPFVVDRFGMESVAQRYAEVIGVAAGVRSG
jgi:glycosyltransferase involved in cell wall biosynthesis